MDIHDIPIADYGSVFGVPEAMKVLDLNIAGDFIVMSRRYVN